MGRLINQWASLRDTSDLFTVGSSWNEVLGWIQACCVLNNLCLEGGIALADVEEDDDSVIGPVLHEFIPQPVVRDDLLAKFISEVNKY